MRKLKLIFAVTITALSLSACTAVKRDDCNLNIVASFYPMYIIAENIIGDADGITLQNMARPQTGCLHNYQLTPGDMKKLDTADLFIVNGGGMEGFLDHALDIFPELNTVDSSEGVTVLHNENFHSHEHDEHHDESEHDEHHEYDEHEHSEHEHEELIHSHEHSGHEHHHEDNCHFWVLPDNAAVQAENICNALCELSPENAEIFQENTRRFQEQTASLEHFDGHGEKVCVFNEAFGYFSLFYNLDVELTYEMDENKTPTPRELAEIIETVKEKDIKLLIAADGASRLPADTIAAETGAKVIIMNPILMGDFSPDCYINAINENTRILKGSVEK